MIEYEMCPNCLGNKKRVEKVVVVKLLIYQILTVEIELFKAYNSN